MKTINYEDLIVLDEDTYCSGSYGTIKRCIYDGKIYALKTFKADNHLNGKRRKIDLLGEIDNEVLLTPKFWVKKDNNKNQYLSDFCCGKDIIACENDFNPIKIKLLKASRQAILSMHKEKIIHCDISPSNIMLEGNSPKITDFDNSTYAGFTTDLKDANDFAYEFIKKYGIIPEVDIHMFNLLTISIMNSWDILEVRKRLRCKEYGMFYEPEAKKICNRLFLDSDIPNKDFLIDTLDETSFTF